MNQEKLAKIRCVLFDFDGVFTDNTVFVDQDGKESVRCFRSDGLGLAKLRAIGVASAIVSTETNPVVSARARKLRIDVIQGVADKGTVVLELAKEKGLELEQIAFVGNDINDVAALSRVGLPIAVADAFPEALEAAHWITSKKGGWGAVREVCDAVATAYAYALNRDTESEAYESRC